MKMQEFILGLLAVGGVVMAYREKQIAHDIETLRARVEHPHAEPAKVAGPTGGGETGAELCAKLGVGRWDSSLGRCIENSDARERLDRLERAVSELSSRVASASSSSSTRGPASDQDPRTAQPLGALAPGIDRNRYYYVSELLPKGQVGWGAQIVTTKGFHECYSPQGSAYCRPLGNRQSEFGCRSGHVRDFALTKSKHGHPAYMKACVTTAE